MGTAWAISWRRMEGLWSLHLAVAVTVSGVVIFRRRSGPPVPCR